MNHTLKLAIATAIAAQAGFCAQAADAAAKTAKTQATSSSAAAIAQSNAEQISEIRAQMQALPEWTSRISMKGDFRYRHETINSGSDAEAIANKGSTLDRERERIRARLGLTAKVNDAISVGVRFVTSEYGATVNSTRTAGGIDYTDSFYDPRLDPRSPNVTLGGYSGKKTVALDQAYVEWNPGADWKVTAGKMGIPWARPAQSLFVDGDINPEGIAVGFNHGYFFANAFYFWLNEVTSSNTDRADANMNGGQVGVKVPFGTGSNLTVAASYQKNGSVQGRATTTFYGNSTNGNSTVSVGSGASAATLLRDEFKIAEAFAEYTRNFKTSVFGELPLTVFAQYARNSGAGDEKNGDTLDKAYAGGISLGKASAPGTWEIAWMYEKIEKNALFGQWIDSDFANGNTDVKGHVIKAGYAPFKNTSVNLTWFINKLNVDAGKPNTSNPQDRNYDRLQLDFNFKY